MTADADLPVWTFRPNWSSSVTETLSWLTDVLQSDFSGAEQRRGLRYSPRRMWEFTPLLYGSDRMFYDLSITKLGASDWMLPIWPLGTKLKAALTAGNTTLMCNTTRLGLQPGSLVLVLGKDARTWAKVTVESTTDTSIVLSEPYAGSDFAKGAARVYPLRRAYFTDQPQMTRKTSRVSTGPVRFAQMVGEDWAGVPDLMTYRDLPVWDLRSEESDDLDFAYDRLLATVDNSTGLRLGVDVADYTASVQGFKWQVRGGAEHDALRDRLYALAGRLNPVWVPSFNDDLVIREATSDIDNTLEVDYTGMSFLGVPVKGRQDLLIELRDGTRYCRRITDATLGPYGETITIDSPLPAIPLHQFKQICFMDVMRLDQDDTEIEHVTDELGVSNVSATFRSFPNIRVNDDDNNFLAIPNGVPCDLTTGARWILPPGTTRFVMPDNVPPGTEIEVEILACGSDGTSSVGTGLGPSGGRGGASGQWVRRRGLFVNPSDVFDVFVGGSTTHTVHGSPSAPEANDAWFNAPDWLYAQGATYGAFPVPGSYHPPPGVWEYIDGSNNPNVNAADAGHGGAGAPGPAGRGGDGAGSAGDWEGGGSAGAATGGENGHGNTGGGGFVGLWGGPGAKNRAGYGDGAQGTGLDVILHPEDKPTDGVDGGSGGGGWGGGFGDNRGVKGAKGSTDKIWGIPDGETIIYQGVLPDDGSEPFGPGSGGSGAGGRNPGGNEGGDAGGCGAGGGAGSGLDKAGGKGTKALIVVSLGTMIRQYYLPDGSLPE